MDQREPGVLPRPHRSRFRRWLFRGIVAVVALAMLWLAAINIWLAVWGESVISRRPEKLQVSYQRAWSWWPGQVVARNLKLSAQTARNQWQFDADRARLDIDVLALIEREFILRSGTASGAEFQLRRLAQPGEDLAEAERFLPPIEEYEFTFAGHRKPRPPGKKPWRVSLSNLDVHDVRQVWFDDIRVSAQQSPISESATVGSVSGSLEVVMRGDISMDDIELSWRNAELAFRESTVASDLELGAQLTLAPTSSRKLREPDTFAGLDGEVDASASAQNLDFLRSLLPADQKFAVNGAGQLDLTAVIEGGELMEGSRLQLDASQLAASIDSFAGSVVGSVRGAVEKRDDSRWLHLQLDLNEVDVENQVSQHIATARSASLILEGERPRLGAPVEHLRLALQLPDVEVPDLAVFAGLIPRGLGLDLLGGSGRASSQLELNEDAERASFQFEANNAQLLFRGTRVDGTLKLTGRSTGSRAQRRLTLADTRVSFKGTSRPAETGQSSARPVHFDLELGDTDLLLATNGSVMGGGLRLASGNVRLKGTASDLGFWETPIPGAEWLRLGGAVTFDAEIRLEGGGRSKRIAAPSSIRLEAPNFTAQLGQWNAQANGHVEGDLVRSRGATHSKLEITLLSPSVGREGATPLVTPSIVVHASGPDLSRGMHLDQTRLSLQAARTAIDDFAVFNDYFPTGAFRLDSGAGMLEGSVHFGGGKADGNLRVESQRLEATVAGEPITAEVELSTLLTSNDPASRLFSAQGSTLRLTNVEFPNIAEQSGQWWAVADLGAGALTLGQPLSIDTPVKLQLRDTEPLVHLLGKSRKVVRWFSRILEVQDVQGTGRLILDQAGLRLSDLDITGKGLSVKGRVDLREKTAALLLIQLHGLRAGIEINGEWRDINVLRPRKWFAERSAVWNGE